MKKRILTGLLVFIILFVAACTSTPDPTPTPESATNPLSCIRTMTSEMTIMGETTIDEYRYERNMTFDENGKLDTIEFIGIVKLDVSNLAYEEAKTGTWTPDLVTYDCKQYGMILNTSLNDQIREIKSTCKGNFATLEVQDDWKNSIGITREEIKSHYVDMDYDCN